MLDEEIGDTKGVIRICISKKNRQHYQRTNNDLQNIAQKTKDRVTRTLVKSLQIIYTKVFRLQRLNSENHGINITMNAIFTLQ